MKHHRSKKSVSKFLSLVLRHKPEIIGISVDPAGWVDIDELVEKTAGVANLTDDLIRKVVVESDKQRFAISDDGMRIRANQGHSIQVDLGLGFIEPPEILYHGTAINNLSAIRKHGLVKGNRNHVHLSVNKETARCVGKRHGNPVILSIESKRMYRDGYTFLLSENGVWLTDHVPEEYILSHTKIALHKREIIGHE